MSIIKETPTSRFGVEIAVVVDGEIAGSTVVRKEKKSAKIGYLGVMLDYRRQGVASELLEAAEDWIKRKGIEEIVASLKPVPGSEQAVLELLESHGYEILKNGDARKKLSG